MSEASTTPIPASSAAIGAKTATDGVVMAMLLSISFSHLLNDMIQSMLPAIYPLLRENYALSFAQIGLITLTFQLTASMLQPVIGIYTDKHPKPFSLSVGMGSTLLGLIVLSMATSFPVLLVAGAMVGLGSAVFHPESSRVARMASGGRHGLAQSVFQVGGNAGQSLGPLLAAFIVVPHGQGSVAWFSLAALLAMAVLFNVGVWYKGRLAVAKPRARRPAAEIHGLSRNRVAGALAVLVVLMFSKFFYMASLNNYFTFYLIDRFHLSVQAAQVHLFLFLFAAAAGTFFGGPVGDRIGRRYVIWGSILGVLPFTLALPYVNLFWTSVLTVCIGLILSSAFSAILVYAQELLPGRVGMIAGIFFGFAFGLGGIGAAALGVLADHTSVRFVYQLCAFLPVIGILAVFLPRMDKPATA